MSKQPNLSVVEAANKPKKEPSTHGGGGSGGGSGDNEASFEFELNYLIKDGCFYQKSSSRDGTPKDILLANGIFWIEREITCDSGLADTTILRVSGKRANGQLLPVKDIPAKQFYTSLTNWINEAWGTKVFISTGVSIKDNLRAAIQKYSTRNGDIPIHTVYQYSGWKHLNNEWVYLTGNGGINKTGLIDNIEVDLGPANMQHYRLPAPLSGHELREAAEKVLLILNICPEKPY
ncbi:MAG: hypothetical protein WCG16_13690 [Methylococcales bacterium]